MAGPLRECHPATPGERLVDAARRRNHGLDDDDALVQLFVDEFDAVEIER